MPAPAYHGSPVISKVSSFGHPLPNKPGGDVGSEAPDSPGEQVSSGPQPHVLDADGEALSLGWPLPDQVGPAGVGFEQVVRLLPLHAACKPRAAKGK